MDTIAVTVTRKIQEADKIFAFELERPDGRALPTFEAGSHIDVHLPNGLLRQYSLCNSPEETMRYRIAVLKEEESRGSSASLAEEILEGASLRISPPRNLFKLHEGAPFSLLMAGGIGITPIIAMAERLHAIGRPFILHYSGRRASAMAFRPRLRGSQFADRVHFHCDDGSDGQTLDLDAVFNSLPHDAHAYVCGPTGYIDAVFAAATRQGIVDGRLHREYFSPVVPPGERQAFTLRLANSNRDVFVAADRSAAEALLDAGVDVPLSCERGVCGACVTSVLEGIPDHHDSFLTATEQAQNDRFTPCCSRSKTAVLMIGL